MLRPGAFPGLGQSPNPVGGEAEVTIRILTTSLRLSISARSRHHLAPVTAIVGVDAEARPPPCAARRRRGHVRRPRVDGVPLGLLVATVGGAGPVTLAPCSRRHRCAGALVVAIVATTVSGGESVA
jgi:hypothetical protein